MRSNVSISRKSYRADAGLASTPVRTSRLVNNELRLHHHTPVVRPFSPNKPQDYQQRGDGDDTTGVRANARILDGLGEGV